VQVGAAGHDAGKVPRRAQLLGVPREGAPERRLVVNVGAPPVGAAAEEGHHGRRVGAPRRHVQHPVPRRAVGVVEERAHAVIVQQVDAVVGTGGSKY